MPIPSLRATERLVAAHLVYKKDAGRAQQILARLERRAIPVEAVAEHIARGNLHHAAILSAPQLRQHTEEPGVRQGIQELADLLYENHRKEYKRIFKIPGGKARLEAVRTRLRQVVERKMRGVRREIGDWDAQSRSGEYSKKIAGDVRDTVTDENEFPHLLFLLGINMHRILNEDAPAAIRNRGRVGNTRLNGALLEMAARIRRGTPNALSDWMVARIRQGVRSERI